ncbi:hypothetical protein LCGC14_1615470, partial [marine sediment metagenome]
MTTIRDELIASAREMPEVFPDAEPANWRRVAEAAVEGELLFYGTEPIGVGRREIDWSGGHRGHQEWRAQLNRFQQLDPLRWAYRRTGRNEIDALPRDY